MLGGVPHVSVRQTAVYFPAARPARCVMALAALAWLSCSSNASACYALIAGSGATADGSVLVGHNEQNSGRRTLNFRCVAPRSFRRRCFYCLRRGKHRTRRDACNSLLRKERGGCPPQVDRTAGMLWSQSPGVEFSDGYLNEHGVAITSNSCPSREDDYETLVARGEIRAGGIGHMLRRLVARQARNARHGVELAAQLIEHLGYRGSGRTYVIADPREAWLLAVVRGRRWAAQRVPDDAVVLLPNVYVLDTLDLDDEDCFRASPDLVSYAVERGWYDPSGGAPFRFWQVYGAPQPNPVDPRQRLGQQLITRDGSVWPDDQRLPLTVRPDRPLTVADVWQVLRCDADFAPLWTSALLMRSALPMIVPRPREPWIPADKAGIRTELRSLTAPASIMAPADQRKAGKTGLPRPTYGRCPARGSFAMEASISTALTQEGAVFQLRGSLPPAIGCVYWRATAEPATSVFTPWYLGIDQTPTSYSRALDWPTGAAEPLGQSAWWTFKSLQDAVRQDSPVRLPQVQPTWQAMEQSMLAEQPALDAEALRLWNQDSAAARAFLTRHCAELAEKAMAEARCMTARFGDSCPGTQT